MKTLFKYAVLLCGIFLSLAASAKADTISQGGVTYTFSSAVPDGKGGFLVDLTINATGATSNGTLGVFAVQFTGATNVTIASSNSGWNSIQQGNAVNCGDNSHPNFWCVQPGTGGSAINVPGGVYTFLFDVTGLSSPPTESDIQAFQGQGGLAISNGVGLAEPSSLTMIGVGLVGFGLVMLAGFLLNSFRKHNRSKISNLQPPACIVGGA